MTITGGFRTLRLSATSGTRDIFSMIASTTSAGAGGSNRVYKWLYHYNNVSPDDYARSLFVPNYLDNNLYTFDRYKTRYYLNQFNIHY